MELKLPALPEIGGKTFIWLMLGLMFIVALAYLVFLWGTWNQYQTDRQTRDKKINELLDRIPKRSGPLTTED